MTYRIFENIFSFKLPKIEKEWVKIEKVPKNLIYATIGGEDQRFLEHFGFDIKAIQKAYDYNTKVNNTVLGGSTITQQTAKNLFLRPSRSYIRKGFEVYFTLLLEILRSKERILEVYLNIIEFGDGIYGISSASEYYFNKPLEKLNNSQISFLIAILPNPRYYQYNKNSFNLINRKKSIANSIYKMRYNVKNKKFVEYIKEK